MSNSSQIRDRNTYCYFGLTGACRGAAAVLGVSEKEVAQLKEETRMQLLKLTFARLRQMAPASILGEAWPEPELQTCEWAYIS